MKLLPTATKTKMVKLLRAMGYSIPSIRQAYFNELNPRNFRLEWVDSDKRRRIAYYSGCAGQPYVLVDREWQWLSMAEAIRFGLVEEK